MSHSKKCQVYRKAAIYLFAAAVFSAAVQGGAISVLALINKLPPSPQKYFGDDVSGFEWFYVFSFLKHFFLLSSVMAALVYFIRGNWPVGDIKKLLFTRQAGISVIVVAMVLLPMLIISFLEHRWLIITAGIKAFLPVLAVTIGFLLYRSDLKLNLNLLRWLLYVNLVIAIAQQVGGAIYCGTYTYGCENIRSTGLFVEPNTLGTLAIAWVLLLGVAHSSRNYFSLVAAFFLVMLSGSRTMVVIFFIGLFFMRPSEKRSLYMVAILSIPMIGYLFASRGFYSLLERASFFKNLMVGNIWFGGGFGYGSQAHNILFKYFDVPIAATPLADSQILSFIYQGGLWLLLSLVAVSIYVFAISNKRISGLSLLMFWISSVGIITMEVWPLNILIFMSVGYALKQENKGRSA